MIGRPCSARPHDKHRDTRILGRRLHRARCDVDRLWRAVRRGRRIETDCRGTGQRAFRPSACLLAGVVGAAVGGIGMGRIAERIGVRWTVAFGAVMIGVGLAVSTGDSAWRLWVGHGLFIGLLGNGGINAPLYIYVSRWFDRRRGTALALISSGQYVAGAIWPSVFERGIASFGWRETMTSFAIVEALAVVPLAVLILRAPPEASRHAASMSGKSARRGCSGCRQTLPWRYSPSRPSRAACRWRCHRVISWRFAAISA